VSAVCQDSDLKSDTPILTVRVGAAEFDLPSAVLRAAKLSGRSALAIGLEVLSAVRRKHGLTAREYFVQGAWIGDAAERSAFVGSRGNAQLNRSLTGTGSHDQTALLNDKYLTGLVLEANGFPVPVMKAGYAEARPFGSLPTLTTVDELADWIAVPENLPVFAKPVDGSMALGSVPLIVARDGMVDLGGREVPVAALAAEVAAHYPRGWLMQELIRQPAEVEALIGPGVGTVRVVTLWEAAGPQVLYGVWRHPAVGTWVDSAIFGKPNVGCALDVATGAVLRAVQGDLFTGREVTQSLVSPDLPLIGYRLPGWAAMGRSAVTRTGCFPGMPCWGGILRWPSAAR
jgi:Sugar-transfer associated ATP-grasp